MNDGTSNNFLGFSAMLLWISSGEERPIRIILKQNMSDILENTVVMLMLA